MRILILTQFYWPEERSAPMNLAALAEFLQDEGHDVTVLTAFPNHPFGRIYPGYRMRWRQWDEVRGVRVLRVPLYPNHSLSALRRGGSYASFALSAATIGAWLTRRAAPDVLFVYLPPLTNWLPMRLLTWLHRVPVVCWETDLWPDALAASGRGIPSWIGGPIRALDRAVHGMAAKVCVNSPGFARRLAEKGVDPARVEVMHDWADESIFFPVDPDPELAAEHGLKGKFNIMYGGNLGPAQGLRTVVAAAERLTDLDDLQFVLVGSGEDEAGLRAEVDARGLTNVRFVPRQPMTAVRHFFALADALLVHLLPLPLFELQIPSKIMAYLACGRPILCAVSGAGADVVREAGAGVCAPPGDPDALAAAARRLYGMAPTGRQALGDSGRRVYLERYTRAVQSRRFEQVLAEVVRTHRSSSSTSSKASR
jgi:glycosyltransferase involved in cell wall biosynthesis